MTKQKWSSKKSWISIGLLLLSILFPIHSLFANESKLFLRMEPIVLGFYTQGNEVKVALCCDKLPSDIQEIEAMIQYTNLAFQKCDPGTIYQGLDTPVLDTKVTDNQIQLNIKGNGRYSSMANMNSIAIFTFTAETEGTARFWMPHGLIKDMQGKHLSFHFLPSSLQVRAPKNQTIQLQIGSRRYMLGSKRKVFSLAPIIVQGRTLVPLRSIAEDMGATVEWSQKDSMVQILLDSVLIEMKIGKMMAIINGKSRYMDVPPILYKGTTMIPLRYIAETLGGKVGWNAEKRHITIDY
jgi:hypothetical protein